jgi:hypothetical protein
MGIKKDAGELLGYFYKKYRQEDNVWITGKDVLEETKWEPKRINQAVTYLRDLNLIKINFSMGNYQGVFNFGVSGLTPIGINILEDEKEFSKNFGFEINLGTVNNFAETTKNK